MIGDPCKDCGRVLREEQGFGQPTLQVHKVRCQPCAAKRARARMVHLEAKRAHPKMRYRD